MSSEHPEVSPVFRTEVSAALKLPRKTREFYTNYEWTYLMGVRAKQLEDGAKPLVTLEGLKTSDPRFVWSVAKREIAQRKLPFLIRRQMPDGSSEYWSTQELESIW
jgi:DNA-directed RNA polymerase I, II, and III subunit RPABC2